jgi:hypothetical protein
MPSFKIRQGVLANSGIMTGSLGNTVSKLQFGSGTVYSPSFLGTGGSAATGTLTIPNAATGDKVFITAASAPAGLQIGYGYISAASVLTLNFQASGCVAIASCQLTINYLLLSGS